MITRIHVRQDLIRRNNKVDPKDRVQVLKAGTSRGNQYGNRIVILGQDGLEAAVVVYSPDKPLSCGAKVWIESKNEVKVE